MIGADHPARVAAIEPVPADQHVLQRIVEGMADVQRAGDIGRRDDDGEGRRIGPRRAKGARVFPMGIPALFELGGAEGLVDENHAALLAAVARARKGGLASQRRSCRRQQFSRGRSVA